MEAANEVPGSAVRRAPMLLWPTAIPPARRREHTRDGAARHNPGTAGRDPWAAPGSVPRVAELPVSGPGPLAAPRQHPLDHVSKRDARIPWPHGNPTVLQ